MSSNILRLVVTRGREQLISLILTPSKLKWKRRLFCITALHTDADSFTLYVSVWIQPMSLRIEWHVSINQADLEAGQVLGRQIIVWKLSSVAFWSTTLVFTAHLSLLEGKQWRPFLSFGPVWSICLIVPFCILTYNSSTLWETPVHKKSSIMRSKSARATVLFRSKEKSNVFSSFPFLVKPEFQFV